uniref:Uncharacterized protein n=1 Tax=Peronospora matthiolae TaxID=2874970 RepID=A0AAV1UBX0_9STRA
MLSAVLCLAVVCSALLSITDAKQLIENDARVLQAAPTTSWPSLYFAVTLKGGAMVYGQSEFPMFANPVLSNNGNSVIYNVLAPFRENFFSPAFEQTVVLTNYTIVDGLAFLVNISSADSYTVPSTECLSTESGKLALPPINAIVRGIMSATRIAAPDSADQCTNGQYDVSVGDNKYTLCASTDQKFSLTGSNMDIAVSFANFWGTPPDFGTRSGCKEVVKPVAVASTGKSLLTTK